MSMQHSLRLPLAGAVALALLGTASIAAAQIPPPRPAPPPLSSAPIPPPPPAPPPPSSARTQPLMVQNHPSTSQNSQRQGSAMQFAPGTETSVRFKGQNGATVTVDSGMPAHVKQFGPPPSFQSLDANHNGRISQSEAKAYPPLDSDFLFASGGRKTVSRAQYKKWVKTQFPH